MLGVRIRDIHTYRDWGLAWLEPYTIEYPEPIIHTVDIPGTDGLLDLTEAITGYTRYKTRKVELQFELEGDYYQYEQIKETIASYLHGKRHHVYLDTDPRYYYDARLSVSAAKSDKETGIITITGEAQPYKYYWWSAGEEWEWDSFNFELDAIGETSKLTIDGSKKVNLPGTKLPVSPTFICSAPLIVKYKNETVELPAGEYQSPYIVFGVDDIELEFRGQGIVSIVYRAGAL